MQTNFLRLRKLVDQKDLRGKRVLLRLDLNVPITGENVRDDFRIQRSLPTLEFLKKAGAKTIIISHLESELSNSLAKVASYISKSIPVKAFVTKLDDAPSVISSMQDGEIMLENLRQDPGEKENSEVFADKLARLADIYVNDAFAVCHRKHASMVSIPKFLPSFVGPLLFTEIESLSKAFNPPKPFLFIIGGSKFETKLPLIEKYLNIADYVFVAGALANDLFKEKGYEVGLSLVSKKPINLKHIELNPKLIVPVDVSASSPVSISIKGPELVSPEEKIMDIGPRSVDQMADLLSEVKFVIWNGPVGDYENGFAEGTQNLAKVLAESGVETIIGGGDTIAVISKMGIMDKFSFVSTGGGAMIDFLSSGTLPGIEALI
jgi:phosphoglycerate kinase